MPINPEKPKPVIAPWARRNQTIIVFIVGQLSALILLALGSMLLQ